MRIFFIPMVTSMGLQGKGPRYAIRLWRSIATLFVGIIFQRARIFARRIFDTHIAMLCFHGDWEIDGPSGSGPDGRIGKPELFVRETRRPNNDTPNPTVLLIHASSRILSQWCSIF